ncbi:MAG: FlgD immunoglobulin-like domain containing protein, partial [Candidatus Cloacimonadaceae bacterium]|nr:FlgD immunoglobulin-like domain containing protein [Candidatus Cloacimonadaceae bacterium]
HDVTGIVVGDLGAEILFNGAPFTTPIYTGYVFGAPGNLPMLAGTYTVVHPDFAGWVPVSYTITDINMNHSTDFLGIRYILNVISDADGQRIFIDYIDSGLLTNTTIYESDLSLIIGNYELEPAPWGFIWSPVSIDVVGTDFNEGNDYTYTITFELIPDPTLPVELSSFTAIYSAGMFVNIAWVAASETNHLGYNILRNESDMVSNALQLNQNVITPADGVALGTQMSYIYTDTDLQNGFTYYYWLESLDLSGASVLYGPITVLISSEPGDPGTPPLPPSVTKLMAAYPNPFNPSTNIRYSLKEAGKVRIEIYNVKGQMIRTFENNHNQPGYYQVMWDGRDNSGRAVSSGLYLYRMISGHYRESRKMVLGK